MRSVPRFNSWAYSFTTAGKPGPGMLIHQNVLQEPNPEIKEATMGYNIGSTAAGGVTVAMRHRVFRVCMDQNIARWLIPSVFQPIPQQERLNKAPMIYQKHHHNKQDIPDFWIVDGGATSHFTGHRSDFMSLEPIPPKLVKA